MMTDATTDLPTINYQKLENQLKESPDDAALFDAIVNAPFDQPVEAAFLFLGIVVLLQVNKKTGMIDRVALSKTELAQNTTEVSYVPFNEIKIPVDHPSNIISRAITSGEKHDTIDWKFLFEPALTPEQARVNQASAGIAYSAVYPLSSRDGGAVIFSYYQYQQEIGEDQHEFMKKYSQLVDEYLARPTK